MGTSSTLRAVAVSSFAIVLLAQALLIIGCSHKRPDSVVEADALFRAGRLEAAASAYASLPDSAADWRPYGGWRAAVLYRDALRDPVRAEKAFEACSNSFSADDWGYSCEVELGDLRRDGRRHRAAIDSYRAALEQRPRGRYAEHCLVESGRSYLALGEYEQARVEWKELEAEFPTSRMLPLIALERGRSFDLQGHYKESLKAYRSALERFPDHEISVMSAFGVAEAYEQLGMLREAEAAYQMLLDRHPNRALVEVKLRSLDERRTRRDLPRVRVRSRDRAAKAKK